MTEFLSQMNWTAFLAAMLIVELTPGPNMGWLATLSAQYGRKIGLTAVLGVALGLALQIVAAATGLSTVINSFPVAYQFIRWAGVVFMLYLAWEAFSDSGISSPVKGLSSKGFLRGFIANVLNPKALVFYIAVVGQFATPSIGSLWWQILILGSIHLLVATVIHIAIVMTASSFGGAFEKWRKSLWARLIFSVSLIAIAIWIAVTTA
ncbi:LysE family translocator [Robiginitomaculum antarcticum]|uniref:LysE family translocator n=1 Tax=Robiginitomaculum antarcticum TaxID=437507 RepID=UPI00037B8E20|nr:LysE family translocator [Robiginitomaculum antarcticum]